MEGDSIKGILFNNYDKQSGNAMMHMDDHLFIAGSNFNWGEGRDAYFLKLHLDTLATGIGVPDENLKSLLTVFPNPTKEKLYINVPIELQDETFELVIMDILGNKVYHDKFFRNGYLNISHLEPGLFYITVIAPDRSFLSNKFIKK